HFTNLAQARSFRTLNKSATALPAGRHKVLHRELLASGITHTSGISTCKILQTMTLSVISSNSGNNAIHLPPSGLIGLSVCYPAAYAAGRDVPPSGLMKNRATNIPRN
ncbi:MAG: hypothetical protein O3C60_19540, partial [Planctomycetota bacterium]|nr:hypothetical protein [Planctomycetota bacterium]